MPPTEFRSDRKLQASVRLALCFFPLAALFAHQPPCAAQSAPAFPEVPTIAVDDVHAGMKGYGLSVFQGTVPERFDVEVLGVLRNQKPDGDYILARLSGQNLEKSGVVAGMSGSPVYFDGRLAGAVAFSFPFAKEPIAGITPIASMRAIGGGQGSPGSGDSGGSGGIAGSAGGGTAARPATLDEIVARPASSARFAEGLALFARAVTNDGRSALAWSASGFGESSRLELGRMLGLPGGSAGEPAAAPEGNAMTSALGGGRAPLIESDLGPGASVAAIFVDGDLRLAATGTVTDRIGSKLIAFGHPVVGVSEISMPLATSEVITVLSSAMNSFKLANSGQAVGSFDLDNAYGSVGRVGTPAHTVPLVVRILSPVERRFDLRLANVRQFLPGLAAIASFGAWDVAVGTGGVRSVDLSLRVEIAGQRSLALDQSFEGAGASNDALGYVMSVLGYVSQNDFADLAISSIEIGVSLSRTPRAATLAAVRPSRTRLAPGDELELQIDSRGWNGEERRTNEKIVVPRNLPEGKYVLLVGDGASADAARFALAPAPPVRLNQALEILASLHSARDLVILGVVQGAGLSAGGEILPRLPGSMRSIWGASGTKSAVPLRNAIVQNEIRRQDRPLSGLLRVELEIRRQTGKGNS
ncbi:MAG: SpoIVB peptidase S55 domain-containing protein [Thermoanaerobaculia bacterium]